MSRICYVDETITDIKKVIFIALVSKNEKDSFKTFEDIDLFIKNNISKISNIHIRDKAKNLWKSIHASIIDPGFQKIRTLIIKSEFHEHKFFQCSKAKTEIENRKIALKELISKIDCNFFYIDNYSNKELRTDIINFAKKQNKNVYFIESKSSEGIRLADLFLKIFK